MVGGINSMDMSLSKLQEIVKQGSLGCCSPWGHRVKHNSATEQKPPGERAPVKEGMGHLPPTPPTLRPDTSGTCVPGDLAWPVKGGPPVPTQQPKLSPACEALLMASGLRDLRAPTTWRLDDSSSQDVCNHRLFTNISAAMSKGQRGWRCGHCLHHAHTHKHR